MVVKRWRELETGAATPAFRLPATYVEALRALADESEKSAALQLTITEQAPLVQLATAIASSPKSIGIGDYVKVISSQTGFIIGRNNFYEWLRFERILKKDNMPFQDFIDNGWFEVRESTYEHKNTNGPQVCFTTLITGKGQVSVLSRFKKSEYFQKFLNKSARVNSLNNAVQARA
jgi:anti-repressor protein